MINLLRTLHRDTGKRVVVLVDEYDNYILHALGDTEKVTIARQRFQNVFGPLKSEDEHLQFIFITGISKFSQMGVLGFPNHEVRTGFADCLYQMVSDTQPDDRGRNVFLEAYYDFRDSDDLPAFIEAIKTFYAGVPYQWEKDNRNEHYYHALLYTLLVAFGADVCAEEPSAKGQSDITLKMPKGIYVMELKYNDTVDAAIDQIDRKNYAAKYALDGRPVTKVGISFLRHEVLR